MKNNNNNALDMERVVNKVNQIKYTEVFSEAIKIKEMIGMVNKVTKDLKNIELKTLLKPLRCLGDAQISTKKQDIIEQHK